MESATSQPTSFCCSNVHVVLIASAGAASEVVYRSKSQQPLNALKPGIAFRLTQTRTPATNSAFRRLCGLHHRLTNDDSTWSTSGPSPDVSRKNGCEVNGRAINRQQTDMDDGVNQMLGQYVTHRGFTSCLPTTVCLFDGHF